MLGPWDRKLLTAAPTSHLYQIQSLLSLLRSASLRVCYNLLGNLARLINPGSTMLVCAALIVGCSLMGFFASSLRGATPHGKPA